MRRWRDLSHFGKCNETQVIYRPRTVVVRKKVSNTPSSTNDIQTFSFFPGGKCTGGDIQRTLVPPNTEGKEKYANVFARITT